MAVKKSTKSKPDSKKAVKTTKVLPTTTQKTVKPKKAVNKTQATKVSVESFLNSVQDATQRKDSFTIVEMMKKITKEEPVMWGPAIIGFGNVTITSERSGRTVDWLKMGFSPRKGNISLYLGLSVEKYAPELKKLGKHKTGKGCIYINKLEEIDKKVLEEMIKKGGFK